MTTVRWAKVCDDGHIVHTVEDIEQFITDPHCHRCGCPLHDNCPNCSAPIRVWDKTPSKDTVTWKLPDFCYNCGDAYPWRPPWYKRALQNLSADQGPSPEGVLLTQTIRETLNETKHGGEVIKHVRDGDQCYRNRLWHSALGSYLHAFEWTTITYLEAEKGVDIIQKEEQEGTYYNFAGGRKSLLDELIEYGDIDQKTVTSIKSMNRAERRWMAHHKSGETLSKDVDAVRARLREFLRTLFDGDAKGG